MSIEKKEEKNNEIDEKRYCRVVDIRIFPNRYLKPNTAENLLNQIYDLEGIVRGIVHGPSLPKTVYYGPARGEAVNHEDRKTINVKGQDIDLRVSIGEIIITVDIKKLNNIMESIEPILDDSLPCKYMLSVGTFTKTKTTVSDYIKYGNNFENHIDERYIGMVDTRALSSDSINMI